MTIDPQQTSQSNHLNVFFFVILFYPKSYTMLLL